MMESAALQEGGDYKLMVAIKTGTAKAMDEMLNEYIAYGRTGVAPARESRFATSTIRQAVWRRAAGNIMGGELCAP